MELVYALEETPETLTQSLFLMGPTPRTESTPSWRPRMIELLEQAGYDGTVFIPEPRDGIWPNNYHGQVNWEQTHLDLCDTIVAWVPRNMKDMPALTTNVEFGKYVGSGKLIYGRPDGAAHTGYLDWLYDSETGNQPVQSIDSLAALVASETRDKQSERTGGERSIPYQIWETEMFQQWYQSHLESGNRLESATVLWTFFPSSNFLLSYVLRVNLWVAKENRFKSNEYIFSRRNLSCVLPLWKNPNSVSILDTKIVLIKEFRSPVQNQDSFVRELPSGSEVEKGEDLALEVAADELAQETGLVIPNERLTKIASRQLCATLSTHRAFLFIAELTDEEIKKAEKTSSQGEIHGAQDSSERTYVEVRTVGDLLKSGDVDYVTMGMVMDGIAWMSGIGR